MSTAFRWRSSPRSPPPWRWHRALKILLYPGGADDRTRVGHSPQRSSRRRPLHAAGLSQRRSLVRLCEEGRVPASIAPAAQTAYQVGLVLPTLALVTDLDRLADLGGDRALTGVVVGLGLLGTGLAYILYYIVVENLGAVTAASATYSPSSLTIGWLLVDETRPERSAFRREPPVGMNRRPIRDD